MTPHQTEWTGIHDKFCEQVEHDLNQIILDCGFEGEEGINSIIFSAEFDLVHKRVFFYASSQISKAC